MKHETEVLKAFFSKGYFRGANFESWMKTLTILSRKITDTGLYLNFMEANCLDEFNESDLVPYDDEVSIISPCLENPAGFILYSSSASKCLFSLEGYTYGDPWILPDCSFKIIS